MSITVLRKVAPFSLMLMTEKPGSFDKDENLYQITGHQIHKGILLIDIVLPFHDLFHSAL
jgi:hypothetical protein